MAVKELTDAVRALLTSDPAFSAALQALIGKPVARVLRANTPWEQIGAQMLPCFVTEQAPGDASPWGGGNETGLVIGHAQQDFASELDIALLWNEQDREKAADQRAQLPELFVRLFLRNPQPGGVTNAWVKGWVPDQGVRHPLQCFVIRLRAEYAIE